MLSPNDIVPKCRAPSIWSFDSGYGSNTLEDDDISQTSPTEGSSCFSPSAFTQSPIGLGISGLWNVSLTDRLRLRQSSPPVEPVTTKLNVYTTKDGSSTDFVLPTSSNTTGTCATCQVWNLTWPEKNLKCNDCRSKICVSPEDLHTFDDQPSLRVDVPQLEIPQAPRLKKRSTFQTPTRCSACEMAILIDPTKPAQCTSCSPDPDLLSPVSPQRSYKVRRSCAKRPSKLPSHALQLLQNWLRENRNNPYPDTQMKRSLAETCGITEKQVTTWFTNARARGLMKSINNRSHSGSEDEANFEDGVPNLKLSVTSDGLSSAGPATSDYLPNSIDYVALEAEQPSRRGKKKDYSYLNPSSPLDHQTSPGTPNVTSDPASGNEKSQETWQCTFCHQHIAPKSWRRHEETQHYPKRKWTCLSNGPCVVISSRSGNVNVCAFCMTKNPTEEHLLQSHRIVECMQKEEKERTFLRPDHLRQHIKNFHNATLWDEIRDLWRKERRDKIKEENWTCGFCSQNLRTWDIRETHIAMHFKSGATMVDWNDGTNNEEPTSATSASSKKRRHSHNSDSSIFAKLARTLSGHTTRRQPQEQQDIPVSSSDQIYLPTTTTTTTTDNNATSPLFPPLLLPDTVFDSFMAEINATSLTCADDNNNNSMLLLQSPTGAAAESGQGYASAAMENRRCDSASPEDGEMEMDFTGYLDFELEGNGGGVFWEE